MVSSGNALSSLGQDRRQGSGVGLRDFTVVGGGMSLLEKQSTQVREISGGKWPGAPSTSPGLHCRHPMEIEDGRQCGRKAASFVLSRGERRGMIGTFITSEGEGQNDHS